MKYKLWLFFVIIVFAIPAAAQDMGNIAFIADLSAKKEAAFSDAVKFFAMISGKKHANLEQTIKDLQHDKIIAPADAAADGAAPLRRGTLAFMAARYLRLGDSLMYAIFKNKRYAVTACAAAGIMPGDTGQWDIITGSELIEVMGKIHEKTGGDQ